VDVNKNLSKPVTQYYLPKKTESAFAKHDHMVHNHYLDVAKKKIQERDRNSTTSVTPTYARIQTTTDDRKPNPRSNNQTSRSLSVSKSSRVTITVVPKADHSKSSSSFLDSKQFVCFTCHKCDFNANRDACITKLLKEVNSRSKIQFHKTRNSNKLVDQKSHTQKPGRQIFTGHRFSPNKTSVVYKKTSPRSDLKWKPTGRIFKYVGLRWIPTGKLFDSCTSKVDSEPPHGSNVDIPNIHAYRRSIWMLSARFRHASNLGPSILQKSILAVGMILEKCGIATLAILQLGNLVEGGEMIIHGGIGLQVSGKFLMYPSTKPTIIGIRSANPTYPHHAISPRLQQSFTQPQKNQKLRKPKRKNTQVPQPSGSSEHVADEDVYKELGDSLVRAATTASSLEAEQDSGNITKTRSKATPNESSSLGTTSGGGPRCQETIRDTIAQTRFENVSKHSNDSLITRGNTLQSDEGRLKLNELMELCTNLQTRVLDLEKTKTTQQNEIDSLKRRVKKLEKKRSSRTHKLKRLYKVGLSARVESSSDEESLGEDASKQGRKINAIDADEDITLEVFVAAQNENVVEEVVDAAQVSTATTTVTITTEEITLAQALEALKTSKPKVKGIVFQEPSTTITITIISSQQSQDNGKGIMIEEPLNPMEKKVKIMLDKEADLKLQAEKEKEANIALIEEYDDIQAKIDADHQLAERLQSQQQEELPDVEKATFFQQLLEKRRKHFVAKRAEEKRNKPPIKAQ
ncbi:hypothetical protein Tco_0980387, partial [Tanacetum coccineum]